jgi:hypothetical protein
MQLTTAARLAGALTATLSLAGVASAQGQGQAQVPKVEISGDIGGFTAPGEKAIFTPATRVTVAINPKFAIESGFHSIRFERDPFGSSQEFIYAVQLRHMIKPAREPGSGLFLTYGAAGSFSHEHFNGDHYTSPDGCVSFDIPPSSDTDFYPPIAVTVGVGVQKVVAKYLAVRADASVLAVPFLLNEGGGAVRFAAGVSAPIGGYKR